MKRKLGVSRPQLVRVNVFSLENAYVVEKAQVVKKRAGKHENEICLVVADVTCKALKGALNAVMTAGI